MTKRSLAAASLAGLIVGLFGIPWGYAAFGAFFAFGWPASAIFLGGFGLSTLWLGVEGFRTLKGYVILRVAVGGSATALLYILLVEVSDFTLMGNVGRISLFCTIWLATSIVWISITALTGESTLERRLRGKIHKFEVVAAVVAVLGFFALGVLAVIGVITPSQFPH